MTNAESEEVADLKQAETLAVVKSVFDPLSINQNQSDSQADRAKVDFAKDAFNRAQAKVNQLVSDLKTETTALQVAIDKYTAAATRHFSMLADIDRLRSTSRTTSSITCKRSDVRAVDQRYFRLYNIEVPDFSPDTVVPSNTSSRPSR